MAVPKRRTSASKRKMRRAANEKIQVANLVACPKCSEPMVPHRACPACGYYRGRKVISPGTPESGD